jgi:hypothetical protein
MLPGYGGSGSRSSDRGNRCSAPPGDRRAVLKSSQPARLPTRPTRVRAATRSGPVLQGVTDQDSASGPSAVGRAPPGHPTWSGCVIQLGLSTHRPIRCPLLKRINSYDNHMESGFVSKPLIGQHATYALVLSGFVWLATVLGLEWRRLTEPGWSITQVSRRRCVKLPKADVWSNQRASRHELRSCLPTGNSSRLLKHCGPL